MACSSRVSRLTSRFSRAAEVISRQTVTETAQLRQEVEAEQKRDLEKRERE